MSNTHQPDRDRSISIGGNVIGGVIQTGDNNMASVSFQQASLPEPENVDIRAELDALREVLSQLKTPDLRKIENALEDAEEEIKKLKPEKDEVGQAIDRALNYAQKAEGFSAAIEKLQPRVTKVVAWLGDNWYKLLSLVGLSV